MADKTGIEWTDATWNPIRGCSRCSEGCRFCYAETIAARFSDEGAAYHGFAERGRPGSKWTGKVALVPKALDLPLRWQRPRRIFVNSMSDLFHEALPDEAIDQVFAVMALASHHTFQVLTKRAERMLAYMTERWQPAKALTIHGLAIPAETSGETRADQVSRECEPLLERFGIADTNKDHLWTSDGRCKAMTWQWPLPNVWLGVSVENQPAAEQRIPALMETPAVKRFLSCEPLLGPLNLREIEVRGDSEMDVLRPATWQELWDAAWSPEATGMPLEQCIDDFQEEGGRYPPDDVRPAGIDWVIAGGESGPNARPANPQWFRDIRDQCAAAGVPFFFKQWGEWVSVSEVEGPGEPFTFPDGRSVRRVGKRKAGNTLDHVQHLEFPA